MRDLEADAKLAGQVVVAPGEAAPAQLAALLRIEAQLAVIAAALVPQPAPVAAVAPAPVAPVVASIDNRKPRR